MRKFSAWIIVLLALVVTGCAQETEGGHAEATKPHDKAWVQKTVKQVCANCHGATGVSKVPTFPIIAGQYKDYLLRAMKDYREGRRKNGVMNSMVKGMTNAQLEALAAYYSRQESPLHTPSIYE